MSFLLTQAAMDGTGSDQKLRNALPKSKATLEEKNPQLSILICAFTHHKVPGAVVKNDQPWKISEGNALMEVHRPIRYAQITPSLTR